MVRRAPPRPGGVPPAGEDRQRVIATALARHPHVHRFRALRDTHRQVAVVLHPLAPAHTREGRRGVTLMREYVAVGSREPMRLRSIAILDPGSIYFSAIPYTLRARGLRTALFPSDGESIAAIPE